MSDIRSSPGESRRSSAPSAIDLGLERAGLDAGEPELALAVGHRRRVADLTRARRRAGRSGREPRRRASRHAPDRAPCPATPRPMRIVSSRSRRRSRSHAPTASSRRLRGRAARRTHVRSVARAEALAAGSGSLRRARSRAVRRCARRGSARARRRRHRGAARSSDRCRCVTRFGGNVERRQLEHVAAARDRRDREPAVAHR